MGGNRGSFKKGGKGGPGRKPGVPNKLTKSAKEAFALAFDELGGFEGLVKWARSSKFAQSQFYTLYARLIPVDHTSGEQPLTQIVLPHVPGSAGTDG